MVSPGDQAVVRAGTYAGFNLDHGGTAAAPVAFAADPGVTIDSPNPAGPHAGQDGINLEGADYVVIDGSFSYRPAAGYVGDDAFTYSAHDGSLSSDPATVTLHVTNQAPTATDDAYKVGMGKTLSVSAPGVLKNDTDADGDARTAVLETGPAHGTLKLNANGSTGRRPWCSPSAGPGRWAGRWRTGTGRWWCGPPGCTGWTCRRS